MGNNKIIAENYLNHEVTEEFANEIAPKIITNCSFVEFLENHDIKIENFENKLFRWEYNIAPNEPLEWVNNALNWAKEKSPMKWHIIDDHWRKLVLTLGSGGVKYGKTFPIKQKNYVQDIDRIEQRCIEYFGVDKFTEMFEDKSSVVEDREKKPRFQVILEIASVMYAEIYAELENSN
jgi:hypothetical protein